MAKLIYSFYKMDHWKDKKKMIWLSIIIATLAIQIPNVWAINKFASAPGVNSALVVALFCLPTSFISTACYAYFYGKGFEQYSYPAMAISAYGISLLCALVMQVVVLRSKALTWVDTVSAVMVIVGLLLMVFRQALIDRTLGAS